MSPPPLFVIHYWVRLFACLFVCFKIHSLSPSPQYRHPTHFHSSLTASFFFFLTLRFVTVAYLHFILSPVTRKATNYFFPLAHTHFSAIFLFHLPSLPYSSIHKQIQQHSTLPLTLSILSQTHRAPSGRW